MRRVAFAFLALVMLAVAGAAAYVCQETRPVTTTGGKGVSDDQDFALVERGKYLMTAADCAACHTVPGGRPFAGGRPIETPFGMVRAPNITPDRDTGIGAWSDAAFDAALREGKRSDGQPLYPAMPYPYYTKMPRQDVRAVRAYLNTVEPVSNKVVADQLPFPFSIRAAMLAWNILYFREGDFRPDPARSDLWNRGAYLVTGPGHCGACHTPKSVLGGDQTDRTFQGAIIQGWFAPDITDNEKVGLGRWNEDDVVAYLKTGHNRFVAATGPMAEEVALSSSRLTTADLLAIATFLKSRPGRAAPATAILPTNPAMQAGAAIYRDACSTCHAPDGRGIPMLFPNLASSSSVQSVDATTLVRVILRGARSAATSTEPTAPAMPAFGWQLDDTKVAAVTTYIRNAWGNAATAVDDKQVERQRAALAQRPE